MGLQLSYFAWVREAMGCTDEVPEIPGTVGTVADLIQWLAGRDANGARAFADPSRIRAAVDGNMAGPEASIINAREVALFPPVTGG